MDKVEITADHSHIYLNEKKLPLEGGVLSICIGEESTWDSTLALVNEAKEKGKWILWEIDLKLKGKPLFLEDTGAFFSLSLTLKAFTEKLLTPFKEHTLGVSLFTGDLDFESCFLMTEQHEMYCQEKKEEYPLISSEEYIRQLFAADVFIEYLLRLHAFLPDDVLAFCRLDASSMKSYAKLAFLLSKERFSHLLPILEGTDFPLGYLNFEKENITTAVTIPSKMSDEALDSLDETFRVLQEKEVPFRVIDELLLNEHWDGIDDLIVLSDHLSLQGMRRVQGFVAAGGKVVTKGKELFLSDEVFFEDVYPSLAKLSR